MTAWARPLSILLLLMTWQVAALLVDGSATTLPGPVEVGQRLAEAMLHGDLLHHLGVTLARVAASFAVAMFIGSAIGIAMGRVRLLDRLFDGWLVAFLNLPALVTIILAYVWFGLGEAAALLAVAVNKIPNVAVTLREGARRLDPRLDEVAAIYRFDRMKTLRHLVLPQLAPYGFAAARGGLALIWKIVLVVELLGRSDGIGFQLHVLFQMFDIAGILAHAIAFIVVVQTIEWAMLQPLERRSLRWRHA